MRHLALILITVKLLIISANATEPTKVIKIGTGSILEGYYNIGLTICEYIAQSSNCKCEVVPTNGSIENLSLLQNDKVDFAIIQSNIALSTFDGSEQYTKVNRSLRQVLNLYDEIFTIVAKDDDKIKVFADIAGKRISNGNPSSASTLTFDELKKYYSFAKPIDIELSQEDYAKQLCEGNIDAIILVTGHPNALVSLIANHCNVDFVAIEQKKMQSILAGNKAYGKAKLLKNLYPGISIDQDTISMQAILITTDKIDPKIVENLVIYFAQNKQRFMQSHQILKGIDDDRFFNNFVLPSFLVTNSK
ncbi:MAG: TAXI family TRAP transporter solute-binding subunit [Rickettsiaceae bacterium]|nr:MAG: TAXI family TRAP transporter solute-binding subunit [Rickettsiaceae bacterium]